MDELCEDEKNAKLCSFDKGLNLLMHSGGSDAPFQTLKENCDKNNSYPACTATLALLTRNLGPNSMGFKSLQELEKKALTASKAACEKGDAYACYAEFLLSAYLPGSNYGAIIFKPSPEQNEKLASKMFNICKQEDKASACRLLYKQGEKLLDKAGKDFKEEAQDKAKALETKACEAGDDYFCWFLADNTKGEKAAKNFEKRALDAGIKHCLDGKSKRTCLKVGKRLKEKNKPEAIKTYGKACDMGDNSACLSTMKVVQGFDPVNAKSALPYLQKGCDKGFDKACEKLCSLYEGGLGIDVDLKKATSSYEKACNLEAAHACSSFKELSCCVK